MLCTCNGIIRGGFLYCRYCGKSLKQSEAVDKKEPERSEEVGDLEQHKLDITGVLGTGAKDKPKKVKKSTRASLVELDAALGLPEDERGWLKLNTEVNCVGKKPKLLYIEGISLSRDTPDNVSGWLDLYRKCIRAMDIKDNRKFLAVLGEVCRKRLYKFSSDADAEASLKEYAHIQGDYYLSVAQGANKKLDSLYKLAKRLDMQDDIEFKLR